MVCDVESEVGHEGTPEVLYTSDSIGRRSHDSPLTMKPSLMPPAGNIWWLD